MGKQILSVMVFLWFVGNLYAQFRPMTDSQRAQQQAYIRNDTLPVCVTPLPPNINTHFSEYAGRLFPDSSFYYTSMRSNVGEDYDHLFETTWDCSIFESKLLSDGHYADPERLPTIINAPNTFSTNYCFNEDRTILIYSRCRRLPTDELQCELWKSIRTNKGWEKAKKMPESINEKKVTTMQPCLVSYPDYQVLYFVSNRKHGIGELDIWYSIYKNDKFETPINAGSVINTEGNEITPFYDKNKSILYFSSDEHLGIGDYDIFFSEGALSQWNEVTNMGVPFNSVVNDYYLTFNEDGKSGYLSSNRPSALQSDEDTCCNDLFSFSFWAQDTMAMTHLSQDTLSIQEKIASVLPITLYFENDYPDPKSLSDTTSFDYETLYEQYLAHHLQYVNESGVGFVGDSLIAVRTAMNDFFIDSVATGYDKLVRLTNYLTEAMAAGETVQLRVSGFASPLHNSNYNKHLSARRIVSLMNYLYEAHDFYLAPYIEGRKTGLQLRLDAYGALGHDFSSSQIRETVYGLHAAKARKIVISKAVR